MLIDAFDWSALTHVYGSATNVPELHAAMLEGDFDAYDELVGALYHQGDVCDAAAAYALVLGEELARGESARQPAKCLTILTLFALALRNFPPTSRDRATTALERVREGGSGGEASMNHEAASDAEWAAMQEVLPAVAPFLQRADTRFEAAELAATLEADAGLLRGALSTALESGEPNEEQRAALVLAVGATAPYPLPSPMARRLNAELETELPLVSQAAAMALAAGGALPLGERALDALADAVRPDLPDFFPRHGAADIAQLVPDQSSELLERVLRRAGHFEEALVALRELLVVATGRQPPWLGSFGQKDGQPFVRCSGTDRWEPRDPLPAEELAALRLALEVDMLWSGQTDLFERLSLPSDREALRALVERSS